MLRFAPSLARHEHTPESTPWHPRNCPAGIADPQAWSRECEDYCRRIRDGAGPLRRDRPCQVCGFGFVYHTSRPTPPRDAGDPNYYDMVHCCNPKCRASRRVYNLDEDDATICPWHPGNCPWDAEDPDEWSARCRAWCDELNQLHPAQTLPPRATQCRVCGFYFCVHTRNYSLRSSGDVVNRSTCCNPECRAEFVDHD